MDAIENVQRNLLIGKYYDMIFMDCFMPVMDGFEATKIIKNLYIQGKLKTNPFICALTAGTPDDFKEQFEESGMDSILSKPISQKTVNDFINEFRETGTHWLISLLWFYFISELILNLSFSAYYFKG